MAVTVKVNAMPAQSGAGEGEIDEIAGAVPDDGIVHVALLVSISLSTQVNVALPVFVDVAVTAAL